MFDRILVAVDGSPCARRAARVGFAYAVAYDAVADVVHVTSGAEAGEELETARRQRGSAVLDEASSIADEVGAAHETHLVSGTPAKAVVRVAEERGADLLVVGQRGQSGLRERLLGSTAERILHRSDRPVLVVPDAEGVADHAPPATVLGTTDGSAAAERSAPYAADVARQCGAGVHVVSALDVASEAGVFDAGGVSPEFVEQLEANHEEMVADYAEEVRREADVPIEQAVVRGRAHEAIDEYVGEHDVDLVVLSSRGESSLAGHVLGSVADRVLRVVDVPVFVVPQRD